jgi:hypothetical protein
MKYKILSSLFRKFPEMLWGSSSPPNKWKQGSGPRVKWRRHKTSSIAEVKNECMCVNWSEWILSAVTKLLKVEGSEKWGLKWSEVKWSEVKISGGMCLLSLIYSYAVCMWVTTQHFVLCCCFAVCYVLITRFMFFCFVCFAFYFVRSVFMYCFLYCFSSCT